MSTKQAVETYIMIDGAWVDISTDARLAAADSGGGHTITRPGIGLDPSELAMVLNNKGGKYSPRNPLSPYFGKLGRNTPITVSLPYFTRDQWMTIDGRGDRAAFAAHHASFNVTDLDVRFDGTVWNTSNPATQGVTLVSKYETTGNQRSWAFRIDSNGFLQLFWSPDGTVASRLQAKSTVRNPYAAGERMLIRVTLDVNNGSGGYTVAFWTSDGDLGGTWTQLGSQVIGTSTTNLFNSSADLRIGTIDDFANTGNLSGRVYEVQLRASIVGTIVARPDWRAQSPGQTTYTDTAGRLWTLDTGRVVEDLSARFVGEIADLPVSWTLGEGDAWVQLTAYGILHRLGQGEKQVKSPIWSMLSQFESVGWLPLESSPASNGAPNGILGRYVDVTIATDDDLPGSAGVAVFNQPTAGITLRALPAAPGAWSCVFYIRMNSLPASDAGLMSLYTTGTARVWTLTILSSGVLRIAGAGGVTIDFDIDDPASVQVTQGWLAIHVGATQQGGNVLITALFHAIGSGVFWAASDTYSGTVGAFDTKKAFNHTSTSVTAAIGLRLAHVFLTPTTVPFVTNAFARASNAYTGELAAARAARLCVENNVPLVVIGDPDKSQAMGAQRPATFLDLLRTVQEVDDGRWYETRGARALTYRTGRNLYNQTPLEVPYTSLIPPLSPMDDLKDKRNDVTITRTGGGSYRSVGESGPLNVNDPAEDPQGIGRIVEELTWNLANDDQTKYAADWRRAGGTIDEFRIPSVKMNLHTSPWTEIGVSGPALLEPASAIVVSGLPVFLPPDDIEQLVRSITEELDQESWTLTLNTESATLYRVGILGETTRTSPVGSATTASFLSGTDTVMTVQRTNGDVYYWLTGSASPTFPFDIMVSGVRLRVTSISGTSDPQTLAVAQVPINGIVKTIPSGSRVTLATAWRLAR